MANIGLDDGLIGIVSSLVSLAFLFQLVTIFVVQRIANVKRFVIIFHALSHFLLMFLYFIPFLPWSLPYKEALVVVCILAANCGKFLINSMLYKWANSYVDPNKRASFSAGKEMISLATGIVMTLVLGYIMDAYEAANNLEGGFIFAAIAILIFNICDIVSLLLIKKDANGAAMQKQKMAPLGEVMKNTLGNRCFRNVIILTILWDVARYTTIGFLGFSAPISGKLCGLCP
jgi:Na+/melibiose symporter-like transporter